MLPLHNTTALIIGDGTEQMTSLQSALQKRGVATKVMTCSAVTDELLRTTDFDIVIFNHLHKNAMCSNLIPLLKSTELNVTIPVLAFVDDDPEMIQTALEEGAADYLTPNENIESVVQKIETLLQGDSLFSGSVDIDITPEKAKVTATGVRVFVVEDDPLLRNLLSIKLNKSFFPCHFSNGEDGTLNSIREFKPDVIVLDLMLPGKSGFDILTELKATDDLKSIPVIVFSNRDGVEDRDKAKELGAVGFYVKAMTDLSVLVETIEKLTVKSD